MPDGLPVAGLFGGALVLAALAVVGLTGVGSAQIAPADLAAGDVLAVGAVIASGVVLVRRLRSASGSLERTARQVEEAGSRLQVLVEHVPAAVYIDLADPDVS
ncbi:MAG TPA: hypothetical protein VIM39_06815, partial [Candidatus Limnocylindrales bacterium]